MLALTSLLRLQTALKLINAALPKHKDSQLLRVLKGLALIRLDRADEAFKAKPGIYKHPADKILVPRLCFWLVLACWKPPMHLLPCLSCPVCMSIQQSVLCFVAQSCLSSDLHVIIS